jgi:hypothetical protein
MALSKKAGVISILIFLAFAICCPYSVAQETRITFRGAYIGQPVTDFVKCDGKPKAINEGYRTHGKSCDAQHFLIFHTKTKGHLDPKTEGESFRFDNGKLTKIIILIPNNDWDKVRFDLTQKLGEPLSEVPQMFQNGFGAR